MKWNILTNQKIKNRQDLLTILLKNRKIDIDNQNAFFKPMHPTEVEPQTVNIKKDELEIAGKIINKSIQNNDKILIFGDYDADGITASAMLLDFIKKNEGNVEAYLPNREEDGYGLSIEALQKILKQEKYDLVITVDNGIVADRAVKFLKQKNIKVIITDHHQPQKVLPPADAIVHSTAICGAAVAWMLLKHYHQQYSSKIQPEEYLDLVGIATIADVMELTSYNRSFAKHGLLTLQRSNRQGLKALMQVAKVQQRQIDAYCVGFMLGPRINAAGRLADASIALDLLISDEADHSKVLAKKLDQINSQRQNLTSDLVDQAIDSLDQKKVENIVVTADDEFHEGIIGLIAGRISQKYHRPAIAMSLSDNVVKASVRSVKGVDITQILTEIEYLFTDFGGHAMAAGFSFEIDKKTEVMTAIKNIARSKIKPEQLVPSLNIEANLNLKLVEADIIRSVNKLFAPFGHGNRKPIFSFKNTKLVSKKLIGSNNNHLKVLLVDESLKFGKPISGIGWRMENYYHQIKKGQTYDFAGYLDLNHWKGQSYPQLIIKDIRVK